jgi:hypothetical protein
MCQANANNSTPEGGDPAGSDILQRLVSEAVKKVLQHPEMLAGPMSSGSESSIPQALVSQVVEELKPSASQIGTDVPVSETLTPRVHKAYLPPAGIPSYKPTPISELKKRHIPVPYTPSPAPRGTSKVQVKRLSPSDDNSRQKRVKLEVKDSQKAEQEYNPETDVSVKSVSSSLKYSPPHNGWSGSNQLPSYVPSSIDMLPKCSNDYIPLPVNSSVLMPQYCPTEKSGSSSEPNYIPVGSENNTSEVLYMPSAKTELQSDIVDIDLSTEFDLLDEILNENSSESQKGSNLKAEEDCTAMHSVVNSDEPKLNVESDKSEINIDVQIEPKDVRNGSKHNQQMGTQMHARSHSEPQVSSSSSSKKEDKLERSNKSKSKRHSSEKTKEQGHKRDRKHSSSSRSEHRKSDSKSSKSERQDRTKKKDTSGDSKSQKHHKAKEESRTKERRVHNSEKQSEKHSSSKMLVKGKGHSGTSRLKHEGKDHHHHHRHYKSKRIEKYHQNSKSQTKEYKTAMFTTRKMAKERPAEDSGINAGKLLWLY